MVARVNADLEEAAAGLVMACFGTIEVYGAWQVGGATVTRMVEAVERMESSVRDCRKALAAGDLKGRP